MIIARETADGAENVEHAALAGLRLDLLCLDSRRNWRKGQECPLPKVQTHQDTVSQPTMRGERTDMRLGLSLG
jgi:hypothetical protein